MPEKELEVEKETEKKPDTGCVHTLSPPGSSIAMLIRIFGKKGHEPYGDIVHYNLGKPVPYQGSAELVLRIDAISRSLDLPAAGNAENRADTLQSIRRPRDEVTDTNIDILPGGSRKEVPPEEFRKKASPDESWKEAPPEASRQEAAGSPPPKVRDTIYLQLIGHQHTSIQGRIWGRATKRKYISFRSALELIGILSDAV